MDKGQYGELAPL